MTFRLPTLAAAALIGVASLATTAPAQTVSGQFVIAGKPLKPKHVAAFRVRDQRAPRTMETYVMLTLTPVDAKDIGAALDPYAAAINDPAVRDADYLAFSINAAGVVTLNAHSGGTQYLDSTAAMMGTPGSLVATCAENTAARVACTVKTAKPVKSMDGPTWSLDVTFAGPVATRAAGTPLPADGGPAGQALLALVKAVAGKDLSKILALLTPGQAQSYKEDWRSPAENLASAKDILSVQLPKQPKITGGEQVSPDQVVLEVEGVPYPGGKMLYLVEMTRAGGQWQWSSSIPAGLLR